MVEEDAESVVLDIPKPRRYAHNYKITSFLKKTKRKVGSVKTKENKYSFPMFPPVTAIKTVPVTTITKDEILLPYLRFSKHQERNSFIDRLGINLQEEYKIASADLRRRLHVDDPENDSRGITDIDPSFFTCFNTAPRPTYVAPYKSLKYLYNRQLQLRQEIGYRRDCILNIERNYKREQEVYQSSYEEYKKQVKYLDAFISEDYQNSLLRLSKWEEIEAAVIKKTVELECLALEKFNLTSKIVGLDYRYSLQQKYGRFLYYLSPPSWRIKNRNFARSIEIEAMGFDFGSSSEEDTFNVVFEKLKAECHQGLVPPVLFFQDPNEILEIFDTIEQHQLHHFTHVARLAPHTSVLKKGIKLFKDIITQDSAGVKSKINNLKEMLDYSESHSSQLEEKFFKILNGLFHDSVAAQDVLKLQIHLEFCYSKVLNEKPMNLGIMGTAKALEKLYMDYSKRMESVTAENIKKAVKKYIESERLKFRQAKIAARELKIFEHLKRALLRAYSPMINNNQCPIVYPSKVQHRARNNDIPLKDISRVDNRKILTESEIEYLMLFTSWTEKEDPALYLRSLSMDETKQENLLNKPLT